MLKILLLCGILTATLLFKTDNNYSLPFIYSEKKSASALLNQVDLKNGDLIFRKGRSIQSRIVLMADKNPEYSHIGIIYYYKDKPFVIHSVPKEDGDVDEFIKMESVDDFLDEEKAAKFAVYRLINYPDYTTETASKFAYNCYLKKFSFDNKYDLKSDTELYCTELIWKAYKQAGTDLVNNRLQEINFLIIKREMIMPGSIIESELLKKIFSN
jgi:uncharacterized protein YycO